MARKVARCSTGWWVGPSSPTIKLSWVNTNAHEIFINDAKRIGVRM